MYFTKRVAEPAHMVRMDLDAFDAFAKQHYYRWFVPLVDDALSYIRKKTVTIVDVGSGPGLLAREFASRGKGIRVIAIDRSRYALSLGRANCKGKKNVLFKRGVASKLPLSDESADLVVSKDSFHEFSNPNVVLKEMLRVLKPGGVLYIQDLRRDIPLRVLKSALPKKTTLQKLQYYSTRASYTIKEVRVILRQCGVRPTVLRSRVLTPALWSKYRKRIPDKAEFERGLSTRFVLVIKK